VAVCGRKRVYMAARSKAVGGEISYSDSRTLRLPRYVSLVLTRSLHVSNSEDQLELTHWNLLNSQYPHENRGGNWYYFQKDMVKNSPEDSFRVSFDKKKWDPDKREWVIVKVFGSYSSARTFLENLGKNGAATWGYEFITDGKPCKVHLDYDGKGVKDGDHSTIRQVLKEVRAFFKSKFGMDRVEIYTWCGSRETAKGYKNSYHIIFPTLHAANNEVLQGLFKEIWPNGFVVPGEGKSAIDTGIYTPNRGFRLPGCSKHGLHKEPEVPFGLLTRDPFDPDDDLSPTALPDTDFKATERSLLTVIDPDSTLLDLGKTESKTGKRKRAGGEPTSSELSSSGRATRPKTAPPPPHRSDATVSPGKVEEVASVLVRTHPRIGSGYDEWFRTLCAILNEAGRHAEAELLAVEYSRIRESYKGVSDVQWHFRGLQVRGSGGTKSSAGSLKMWAKDDPALVFTATENSSGLGPVEGAGVNKVWANKLDQMLRWVDTGRTSCKWLVQCVSYLAQHAELQMRSWVQQHYPLVSDEEFKNIWCIQTRSEYYENALKDYVLQELEELGAPPRVKRARRESDSGRGGTGSQPRARRGSDSGKGGAGSQPTPAWSDGENIRGGAMDCDNTGCESALQEHESMVQDSETVTQSQTGAPPVPDAALTEAAAATSSSLDAATSSSLDAPTSRRRRAPMALESPTASKPPSPGPVTATTSSSLDAPTSRRRRRGPMALESPAASKPPSPGPVTATTSSSLDAPTSRRRRGPMVLESPAASKPPSPGPAAAAAEPPNIIEPVDFDNLTEENLSRVTKHMDVKYLNADDIDPNKDYVIESGWKTGKSSALLKYAKQSNLSVLHIVNLRSSRDGVREKFKDCNVLSYEPKPKFKKEFVPGRSVVITLDSLLLLEEVDFRAKDYVVYLDEMHTLKTYLARSETLGSKRARIWALFARITKNCRQFIAADNDITDVEVDFLLKTIQRDRECEFWKNSFKSYGGVAATEISSVWGMETLMYTHIVDGHKFVACFNGLTQANEMEMSLKEKCKENGVDTSEFKLFTSMDGGRITDIDAQWDDFYVFHSPVVVTGRDFNPDLPTTTFCFIRGTHTLSPEECAQQLARNRNMSHLYFHLENVDARTPSFETVEAIKECFKTERSSMKAMDIYQDVCDKRVSECGDSCEIGDNVFTDIVCKVEHRRHLMGCNFRHYFIKILKGKGFQVEESDDKEVVFGYTKNKKLGQLIQAEKDCKIDAFIATIGTGVPNVDDAPSHDVFLADARRRAEILHLPHEKQVFIEYKDEVFDDYAFKRHLNVRRLAQSKETSAENLDAAMQGDVSLNATQTAAARVALVCDLFRKCLPDYTSVLEFQASFESDDTAPMPEGGLKLWEVLNRDEEARQIPENRNQLIKSLVDTGKKLFGKDFVIPEYTRPRRNGKKYSKTCYTVNPKWRDRHMNLLRFSAHTQWGKLDSKIAHRYGLLRDPDFSNPNTDADERIQERKDVDRTTPDSGGENLSEGGPGPVVQVCEPMGCSKTLEDSDLEQNQNVLQ
jgi:hypothetical protein